MAHFASVPCVPLLNLMLSSKFASAKPSCVDHELAGFYCFVHSVGVVIDR